LAARPLDRSNVEAWLADWSAFESLLSEAGALASFAYIAAAFRQPVRAVHLGAAAAALTETYRTPLIPHFEPALADGLEIARPALGETAYAVAVQEGREMSLEAAVAEALAVEVAPPRALPAAAPGSPKEIAFAGLTAAEIQVLRLLTTGRTTKEIAAELVISVKTVETHVSSVLRKTQSSNRHELSRWASDRRLV